MFERFRKKKQPEVIHHKYDIVPPFDYEGKTNEEVRKYFESLSRVQIIEIYDKDTIPEAFHDEFFEVENKIKYWPTDDNVIDTCNVLRWNSDSIYHRFNEIEKQVQGMQKKLDIMTKLVENTEVTMSAKTALNLCK